MTFKLITLEQGGAMDDSKFDALHEKIQDTYGNILVSHIHPSIPVRQWDWCAYIDGQEEKTEWQGWGKTAREAIEDLLTVMESGA